MTNPYDAIIDSDLNDEQSQPANPYDAAIDRDLKSLDTLRAQSSMKAAQTDPGRELEVRQTADRLGIAPDLLRDNLDEARFSLKSKDLQDAVSQFSNPSQQFLLENDNLGVLQEDLPRLKALEEALLNREQFEAERLARERGFFGNTSRGMLERGNTLVGNTLEFLNNTVFSTIRETTDSTSIGVFSLPIEEYERQGMTPAFQIGGYGFDLSTGATEEGAAEAGTVAAPFDRELGYQPYFTSDRIKEDITAGNIAGFIGEQGLISIPDMLGAVFATPAYVASRTEEIAEQRVINDGGEGQPGISELAAAAPAATASALIERFAAIRLFNPRTTTIAGTIGAGIAREAGTEFVQEQIEYAGETVGTQTPFNITESLERGAWGALAGGGMGGGIATVQQIYSRATGYNRARRDREYLKKVGEAANESETDKQVLRDMIARAKQTGPVSEVYVDANEFRTLFQSAGLDPDAIAERMPSVTEQYYESAAIGGDIAISLEDYATVIAETAANERFLEIARTEQNGMSSAEAQHWYDEQAKPMIDVAMQYDPAAENPGGDRVSQDVIGQLLGTGMDQATAERNASLYKAFFSVLGQYEGRDPYELFQEYGLSINREQPEILQRGRQVDEFDNLLSRLRAGEIPTAQEIDGPSLVRFLRDQGGLIDDGGELSAMDVDAVRQPFERRLIQETGLTLDGAAELAAEAGYISEADPNQLLERLNEELRGNPVYSPANANDELRTLAADLIELDDALRQSGYDISTMSNQEIREAIMGDGAAPAGEVEFDQQQGVYPMAPRGEWYGDANYQETGGKMVLMSPQDYLDSVAPLTMDEESVENIDILAEHMQNGGTLDPLAIYPDGKEDGRHRAYAAIKNGIDSVPVIIWGDQISALEGKYFEVPQRFNPDAPESLMQSGGGYKVSESESPFAEVFNGGLRLQTESGVIDVVQPDGAPYNNSIVNFVVDEEARGTGQGGALLDAAVERYGDSLGGAFSSEASVAAAYNRGFRGLGDNAGLSLQELQDVRSEQSSVTMKYNPDFNPVLFQPGTDAFSNWFGDSKVVDENGEPLVVYHGTDSDFSAFDPGKTMDGMFWFSGDRQAIESGEVGAAGSGRVIDAYVSIKNPAGWEQYDSLTIDQIIQEGYDGLILEDDGELTVVAFEPTQIKSATGNRGTFDPADPNILNQDANVDETAPSEDTGITVDEVTDNAAIREIFARYQRGQGQGRQEPGRTVGGGQADQTWRDATSIRGADGQPAPLYRGAARGLTAEDFGPDALGQATGNPSAALGVWFTNSQDDASRYGSAQEFFADIRNPAVYSTDEVPAFDSAEQAAAFREQLESQGYDGIVFDYTDVGGQQHFVAFAPEQVIHPDTVQLNQSDRRDVPRGRINIDRANQNFNIELLEGADLSTFLHETGHYFLEVIGAIASDPAASDRTQKIYQDTLKWMGVDSQEQIGTEQHELFARTFEAYLRDGKAPSPELQPMFQRFAAWLRQIYRSLLQLNANLTDEVRSVFDRMLATDQEIEQAQEEAGYLVSLMDVEGIEWTDDERQRLAELRESARSQAEADLMAEQMKDLTKARQEWWAKEKAEVRQEMLDSLNALPQYQARQMLTAGKRANGDALPEGVEQIKLNKQALVDEFGAEFLKELPSPRNPNNKAPQYVYSREGGEDPSVVARTYGYSSVRAMVNDLIASRPVNEYVGALTDSEMRARYPDINLSGQAAEIAKESVYNDKQAQLMLLELKKLEGMVGRKQTIPRVMRQKAAEMVAGMKVRDIRPDLYSRKTSKYGRDSFDAAARGQMDRAILAKQRELMHHYLYKESLKAREESEKVYQYAKRIQKKAAQERIGKAGGDYLERINEILEKYEFRRVSNKELDRRQSLAEWLKGREADGEHVDVPEEVVARSQRVNWRDVPLEELQAARDAVRNLEYIARNKNRMLADKDKRELEEVLRPVVDQVLSHGDKAGRGFFERDTLMKKVKGGLKDYASAALNMDSILRGLDGYEDLGDVYQAIKAPIDRAAREELPKRQEEYGAKLAGIYNKHFTREEQRNLSKQEFMQLPDGRWLSREQALSVALNMGNEGNLEAVYSGVASAKEQLQPADIQRIKDSLSKADWEFVQDVWDMLDFELWPLVRDAHKNRTGVAPKKVDATPVVTAHGTYRGGYYPIKFDPGLSFRATEQQADEMAQQVKFGSFAKAQTRRGHTIERTNSGGNPLNYSLSVLHSHVEQALVDVTMGDAINDVSRIITHKDFVNAMQRTGNTWALKAMENWLKDTASQEVISSHFLSQAVRHIRVGFTMSKLSWNVGTILLQPFGLAQSIPDIGYQNMLHGMMAANPARWFGENNVFSQIEEKSPFMRTRGDSFNKDIRDTMTAMRGSGWMEAVLERIPGVNRYSQQVAETVKQSLMGGIVATQRAVDGIVWMGAYQKGKQQFSSDSEAIQYADSMVARTQASGIFSDRTAFERGTIDNQTRQSEFVRLWTTMGSYMFAKGNIAYEKTANVDFRDPAQVLRWMHDMFMLFAFEAILIGLMRGFMPDEDDEETKAGFIAEETLYTVMGTMPIIREGASALSGFQGGGVLGSFWADAAKVKTQAAQGEVDAPLLKSLNNVGGTLFRYPSSQTNRVFESLWRDMNGEDVSTMDYLIYRQKDD